MKEQTFGVKEQAFGVKEQDLGGQGAGEKSSKKWKMGFNSILAGNFEKIFWGVQ